MHAKKCPLFRLRQYGNPNPTQPNRTQPMGQPDPWPTLKQCTRWNVDRRRHYVMLPVAAAEMGLWRSITYGSTCNASNTSLRGSYSSSDHSTNAARFVASEMASPRNQHCANCIGTLSFSIASRRVAMLSNVVAIYRREWTHDCSAVKPAALLALHAYTMADPEDGDGKQKKKKNLFVT